MGQDVLITEAEEYRQGQMMKKRYILLMSALIGLALITRSVVFHHRAGVGRNGGEIPLDDQHQQSHRTDQYGDPLPPGAVARLGTLRLRAVHPASEVTFSGDGRKVSSLRVPEVRISNVETGRMEFERSGAVAVYSDSEHVNIVDTTGKLIQYRSDKRESALLDVTSEKEVLNAADFSKDGSVLATWVTDFDDPLRNTTIQLWDVAKGEKTQELRVGPFDFSMKRVRVSPDANYVAHVGERKVSLWNLTTATQQQIVPESRYITILSTSFSPDSAILVTTGGQLRFWDVTGQELPAPSAEEYCRAIAFSPDGVTLALGSGSSGIIQFCDVATGKLKRQLKVLSPRQGIYSLAFSPDGMKIAASTSRGWTRLWDVSSGKELVPFARHVASIETVVFSKDGSRVITASRDQTVRVWDTLTGKHLYRIDEKRPVEHIRTFAVSPSGATLAVTDDDSLRFFDFTTGSETGSLPSVDGRIAAVAFARDDDTLLTISIDSKPLTRGDTQFYAQTLRKFDRRSGRVLITVPIKTNLNNNVFSPDGRTLLTSAFTGTEDQTLVLDGESGMIRRAFSGGRFRLQISGVLPYSVRMAISVNSTWQAARRFANSARQLRVLT